MVTDLHRFEISNWLCLALAASYPLAALAAGLPASQILWALALGAAVLLVGMGLFFLRVFGGGDAKLIAAAAPWTGTEQLLDFLVYTAILGGMVALALLLFRRFRLAGPAARVAVLRRLHARKRDVPYALGIGGAGLLVFPSLPIVTA